MNDSQVRQQVQQMVSFIRQEAEEKANEIRVKAEEEFNARKLSAVEAAKTQIRSEYEKKFKQIESKLKVAYSTQLNASRLEILKQREDILREIYEGVERELSKARGDKESYKKLLEKLLKQSFLTLDDADVSITSNEEDLSLVESATKKALEGGLKTSGGQQVKAEIDRESFLPKTSIGGVIVSSHGGKIVCNNTLEARLETAYQQNLPQLRDLLFGDSELWK
ncbi:V-type proton ATPase subunit E1 [Galdieria sulphuraria]|uniref:V-type H+-transporting ATPase subunit e n=1 Tax=Galdieria sulphuraria TaxID=130081 RepID=M2Y145_GALSU|nr:V-type H+-transporting ATPase subunit e [Galdieria sulphuraria]EME29648.1 V-type H+-transporting ATPase subunit e [Galdieria sulphuraria]GJD12201.1 V-type proton ATPase subunit E1 [Galdieria sulphuraria]|eukprot:XP_005706168.1 V-type H+-transporting ATPase subunit e [Galdieria sulphuraria]